MKREGLEKEGSRNCAREGGVCMVERSSFLDCVFLQPKLRGHVLLDPIVLIAVQIYKARFSVIASPTHTLVHSTQDLQSTVVSVRKPSLARGLP